MALVSVIMAVHNSDPQHLKGAIASILSQYRVELELVIVNDASNAQTRALLNDHQKADPRIRILTNTPRRGLTRSLNQALKVSRGDFIARMDADDVSLPGRLYTQFTFLVEHHFDIVAANCSFIDNEGTHIGTKAVSIAGDVKRQLLIGNFCTHSTFFGTAAVFSERYNEEFPFAQDYELLLRLIGKGYRLGYDERPILQYRVNPHGISIRHAKLQEWYALRARWLAIRRYGYAPSVQALACPTASLLLPTAFKYHVLHKIKI